MSKKKNFPLRIDPEIHNALEKWAADELRSVNSHIEFLLRQSLLNSGRLKKTKNKQK
ncbi:MAG: Arc family DNA-binding protein [Clostridia bacterium]|jgi:hypothetical protein|nr:Arc family DNA-binding protein [Clostridia bacterium]MDD4571701.1 Arc family DNA-binding protein [Clostridia bacterium]